MDGTKTTTNWIIAGLVALAVIIGGGWLISRDRTAPTSMATSTDSTMAMEEGSETDIPASPAAPEPVARPAPMARPTPPSAPTVPDQVSTASGETVTVEDQAAGTSVVVADVKITKPSWVAVRDTRKWYPGATWLGASQSQVTIPLLRSTEAGKTYEVVIFVDDGDKEFEIHGDALVTSSQGAPVSSTFTAK